MPVPWMAWQVAVPGHSDSSADGVQMSAHCDGVWDPEVSRTHSPRAVPDGSVGHGVVAEHPGEQNDPVRPVIWTAVSPEEHPPPLGSSYGPAPLGDGGGPGAGPGGVGGVGPGSPDIGYEADERIPHSPSGDLAARVS